MDGCYPWRTEAKCILAQMNWVSPNRLLVFNELDKIQMGKASLCHAEPSRAQTREAETAALLLRR